MERSYGRYALFLFVLGVSRAVPGDLRLSRRQRRSSHLPTQMASRRSAEASSDALTRACVSPSWTRPCRRPSRRCSSRGRPRAPGSARSGSAGSRARWPRVLHHERQQLPEDLLERGEQPLRRGRPRLQLAVRPAPGFRFGLLVHALTDRLKRYRLSRRPCRSFCLQAGRRGPAVRAPVPRSRIRGASLCLRPRGPSFFGRRGRTGRRRNGRK